MLRVLLDFLAALSDHQSIKNWQVCQQKKATCCQYKHAVGCQNSSMQRLVCTSLLMETPERAKVRTASEGKTPELAKFKSAFGKRH